MSRARSPRGYVEISSLKRLSASARARSAASRLALSAAWRMRSSAWSSASSIALRVRSSTSRRTRSDSSRARVSLSSRSLSASSRNWRSAASRASSSAWRRAWSAAILIRPSVSCLALATRCSASACSSCALRMRSSASRSTRSSSLVICSSRSLARRWTSSLGPTSVGGGGGGGGVNWRPGSVVEPASGASPGTASYGGRVGKVGEGEARGFGRGLAGRRLNGIGAPRRGGLGRLPPRRPQGG